MALIRAMNSAISGLQSQQVRIDTVGDNLANATTTAFKSTRVEFQTMLSQTLQFGTAPQGFLGGTDPQQLGLGVTVASTTRNFAQGELENTGIATDLGIDGQGFFIMNDQLGNQVFTRDGSFGINPSNLLHDPGNGFVVQGVQADLSTFTIASGAPVGALQIPVGQLTIAVATTTATYDGNLDGDGEQALQGTVLQSQRLVDNISGASATTATLLVNLSRDTGSGLVDLSLDVGDTITVDAVKGGRTLPQALFFVASSSTTSVPPGFDGFGTTLVDFTAFLERTLGVNSDGTNYGAIRDNDANPNTPGISLAATATTATSVQVSGVNFVTEGVQLGDIVRFNTGAGAGQIGVVASISTTTTTNDTLNLTAAFTTSLASPAAGDQFTVHEPAAVAVTPGATGNPGLTAGTLRVAGNVGTANGITTLQIVNQNDNISFSPFNQLQQATGESIITNATFYDSIGSPHLVELTLVLETKGGIDALTGSVGNTFRFFGEAQDSRDVTLGRDRVVGDGSITFSTSGQFLSTSPLPSVSLSLPNSGAQTPLAVSLDFAGVTGFADQVSTAFLVSQDGFEAGTLQDFSIGGDGIITGIFSNGVTRNLGQIYLARFANPNGLTLSGENVYQVSANSGPAVVAAPGAVGLGSILSGTLEASNVDFAREFTTLIVAQRGFQANARVITTADRLLEELVQIV